MRPPDFWQRDGAAAVLLSPLGRITALVTARRVARPGWAAPVPVVCCGNATVGGSGKTPLVLDTLARLTARGMAAHALTRGHGGRARGVVRVDPALHGADWVGDEALLLAGAAPCWVGADRAAAARAAIAAGAQALVMDDGLQNPALHKRASILVIDGGAGFGNGRLLPAGPLREPVLAAARRCQAAVIIGEDRSDAASRLPPGLPVLRARMMPGPAMRALAGRKAAAFAGIGRPAKFFGTLREAGVVLTSETGFSDHHAYTARALAGLRQRAAREGAVLVTTTKDFARIAPADRAGIVPLTASLVWDDEDAIDRLLTAWAP
jgi:tetraacyldisaccharide 4'-kinase